MISPACDPWFSDFADGLMLRDRDYVLTFRSYFDESENGDLLCVAGYVFEKRKARRLEREWAAMLAKYRLPYFRMSACNSNNEPFDHLNHKQCIAVQTKAIELIKRYAEFGVAVTIDQREANAVLPDAKDFPPHLRPYALGPYELCVYLCMMSVRLAFIEFGIRDYRVGYFFEDGHRHRSKAVRLIDHLLSVPSLKSLYHWGGGGFVSKDAGGPVQAADVLSWQWCKDRLRQIEGKPRRKDCEVLLERAVRSLHINANEHARWIRDVIRREATALLTAQSAP